MITEERLEQLIISFIEKFEIQRKVGFRYKMIKLFRENEDKDMNKLLADFIAVTVKFKEEENGY